MNNSNKKQLIVLAAGLFLLSFSFILSRYVQLSDNVNGFLKGIGIGVMVIAVLRLSRKKKKDGRTAGA